MKRRITLSIALALSIVLLSLMRPDSTANAQQGGRRFRADTGIITLGPGQVLRVTVAAGDVNGDDAIRVRFRRMEYIEQGNIYRVGSQSTSAPLTLASGEAASLDIVDGASNTILGVRGIVSGNFIGTDRNVRVTAIVFDTSTQRVVTFVNTTFDDGA